MADDREEFIKQELAAWNRDERSIDDLADVGLPKVAWVDFSCRNCDFSLDEVLMVEDEESGDSYSSCPKCDFLYAEVED